MKHVLNELIQLQELHFAHSEQRASQSHLPLKQLEEAITQIQKDLPEEIRNRYQRLQKRFPLALVPVLSGNCAGCGLAVPAATINAVRACEALYTCPHCGRFLHFPETVARRPKKIPAGERPVLTGVARFSATELMRPQLTATTHADAIRELATLMAKAGFVEDGDVVAELVLRREGVLSTAVEHGLAFPHTRDMEGGGLAFALGLSSKGIDFKAPDGKASKIIFLIVIPSAASAFYLRLLAGLAQTFAAAEARTELLQCDTPEKMWKTLSRLTKSTVP